jgi:hypothetical protein
MDETAADDTKAMAALRQEWRAMARVRAGAWAAHWALRPDERDYDKMAEREATWDRRNETLIDAWRALRDERDWARLARETLMG